MPSQIFKNNAKSTLSTAVTTNTQASLVLQSGDGAKFPSPNAPDYFMVTLDDGTNVEVCKCITRSSDTLTVLRGMEGTTAQSSFAIGAKVELRLTQGGLDWITNTADFMTGFQRPSINTTSFDRIGVALPTVVGGQSAATQMNSSWRESNVRQRFTSSQSAQSPTELRHAQALLSGNNGYTFLTRFGFATAPSSSHFFIGLVGTTGALSSVSPPSSITNGVAIGYVGSGLNANLALYHANSQGPATILDLGSYFTVQTPAWYELRLDQRPGNARIDYLVRRLDISSIADVVSYFTSQIPDNSLWLSPYMHGTTLVTSGLWPEWGGWMWAT